MTQTVQTKHVLERLAQTTPEAEIWWDSSPLIYANWKKETLAKDPDPENSGWEGQLTRFLDPQTIESEGKMGFRGVTTNPPLSLQAIKLAPEMWTARVKDLAKAMPGAGVEQVYWALYLEVVCVGVALFLSVFLVLGGFFGF